MTVDWHYLVGFQVGGHHEMLYCETLCCLRWTGDQSRVDLMNSVELMSKLHFPAGFGDLHLPSTAVGRTPVS
jgi:hypothetical protein